MAVDHQSIVHIPSPLLPDGEHPYIVFCTTQLSKLVNVVHVQLKSDENKRGRRKNEGYRIESHTPGTGFKIRHQMGKYGQASSEGLSFSVDY